MVLGTLSLSDIKCHKRKTMIQKEKQKQRSDEDVVRELCSNNGVCYERLGEEGCDISSLEMFFSGFPRMVGLSFFPVLRQLTIVGQSINRIEALDCCPLLEELWVAECHLTEISGLQNCRELVKLYLYDNQIREIKNLALQTNLEILWLNNNCINNIQSLRTLGNLRELNLADNNIEEIGHSLDPNVCLQNLNLSGNKISSFKELTMLACLPNLTDLVLKDPTSIPNPVCLLCNYATHVLYHMPRLQRLDSYDISSEQVKEAAESTVMKKMMYYNMRVRMAERKLAEMRLSLTARQTTMQEIPEESLRTLSHSIKNLERELSMVPTGLKKSKSKLGDGSGLADRGDPANDDTCDPIMEKKILDKIVALKKRLVFWTRKMAEIDEWHEDFLTQATNTMDYTIQFLVTELESVGNIRLQEGCPSDPWFNSCCELLQSRFFPSDFKIYGVTGIKINRIISIHNRALRLRFEDKLHSILYREESDSILKSYKRHLEHLFYVSDPETNEKEEIMRIIEEGFKENEQHSVLATDGAVPFSNSLSEAEQPRIEHALCQACKGLSKYKTDMVPFKHGQIIVSKVFVGHSMPLRVAEQIDRSRYPKAFSVYQNLGPALSEEKQLAYKTLSVPECSPRSRLWFIFDHELILPEYLIYFEYIERDKEHTEVLAQMGLEDIISNYVAYDKEVLSMEPVLKPQPRLLSLDDKILLNVARANVLSQITMLNLHGNSLSKVKEISSLTALRHLTISFNKFTRLDDICHMPNLEFLDASYNQLVTLEGLRGLAHLKQLVVRWNQLTKAREDTAVLRKHTPTLLKLDTRYNPWKTPKAVRMTILSRLTTLTHLDDILITEEEASKAAQVAAGSKINQASLLAHSRTCNARPRSLSLLSTAHLLYLSAAPWGRELEPDWTAKITTLVLDSQKISKLYNLNKLVNLRWASFNDNDISKLEGLDNCLKLEELSVNNNNISSFNGLSKLHCLVKLSLDGNQLTTLDASVLGHLSKLSFLSVENNSIRSLHGIQRARSLLELYLGYNQICRSRDIYCMKGLTNLIILSLDGNPLAEQLDSYRTYVVFHLPTLKALDGIAVEANECESAKDMFEGRLNPDMVAEKLGHTDYADVSYLTLESCSIRTVDLCPPELFSNLRSVNLDHNNLTSFSGLIYLPNIKALCLNYNHIESILPRPKTHLTNRQILHSKVHSSGYGQQRSTKYKGEPGQSCSLEPLMSSLEVLHLSHNGIFNMANLQLSRLTNLKVLFLQGNEISQVEGLEGLYQLKELVLDKNRIKALSETSFIAQSALLELHLAENRIRELNHLEPLTELRKLFLTMNKLQDISELEKLEVLPSLTELCVVGNPVARKSLHRQAVVLRLTQLQVLDGVMVTLEERTRAELLNAESPLCSQCLGASLPTPDVILPGLLPLMPRHTPLKGKNVGMGLQNVMHGHDLLPYSNNETLFHRAHKSKKQKQVNAAQNIQTDMTFRNMRRSGTGMTTTGLLHDGGRVILSYPNQEQDSRFLIGGKPKNM
ncbi:leucine-rich repeat-containing protein 9 isoform X2 [Nelusetta ayraudi]|uniref:leucine-rich repeat-containing protein 9 isoform X2 n=1 Tax=Nelusetta ayraudi TaxID=303726 RepID=UPI003F70F00D